MKDCVLELFSMGVTSVIEENHGMFEKELKFEGNFKDEDVALWIYENIHAIYLLKGNTTITIQTEHGPYTTKFTRITK